MLGRIKNMKLRYKVGVGVATGAALLGGGGAAFAYFTSTGSGTGTGTVGSSQALTINQASITYNGPGSTTALTPGDTATVSFTVDNPGGNEYVQNISLASWTSDKTGCDSTTDPTWITMPAVTVNHDFGHGNTQAVTGNGTITFNDLSVSQNACQGATLTFNYSSN